MTAGKWWQKLQIKNGEVSATGKRRENCKQKIAGKVATEKWMEKLQPEER